MTSTSTHLALAFMVASLALPGPAVAQNTATAHSSTARGVVSPAQPANSDLNDRRFIQEVAADTLFEVELGKLAMQKAGSEPVRRLAQRMGDDHKLSSEHLKAIAEAKGIALPDALDAKRRKEYERLQKLPSVQFDQAYVKLMVEGHQHNIREFRKEIARASDPDIRSYAVGALPKLHDHLAIARDTSRSAYLVDRSRKPSTDTAGSESAHNATAGANGNDISGSGDRVR